MDINWGPKTWSATVCSWLLVSNIPVWLRLFFVCSDTATCFFTYCCETRWLFQLLLQSLNWHSCRVVRQTSNKRTFFSKFWRWHRNLFTQYHECFKEKKVFGELLNPNLSAGGDTKTRCHQKIHREKKLKIVILVVEIAARRSQGQVKSLNVQDPDDSPLHHQLQKLPNSF